MRTFDKRGFTCTTWIRKRRCFLEKKPVNLFPVLEKLLGHTFQAPERFRLKFAEEVEWKVCQQTLRQSIFKSNLRGLFLLVSESKTFFFKRRNAVICRKYR